MSVLYTDVLKRFIQYRQFYNLTQEQLAGILGVTQSCVSKMEGGRKKIPYSVLVILDGCEWDIDSIITGEHLEKTELDELFETCEESKRMDFLQYVLWAMMQGVKGYERQLSLMEQYAKKIEYIRLHTVNHADEDSVLYGIRAVNNLSQHGMAQKLQVDIKKYRALEKKESSLDAELLMNLYNEFDCMPFDIIHGSYHLKEVNRIWCKLNPELKEELLEFIKRGLTFLNR
jgi:transcriptional regulator with XRE-family HTH domain